MKLETCAVAVSLLVSTASAFGPNAPKPKAQVTKVEDFQWTDPFANRKYKRFTPTCESEKTFHAYEYQLHDLSVNFPEGLWPFDEALKKVFSAREYPGTWGGWDHHQYDRTLLMMEYADLPLKVREWIEDQERNDGEGKGLFAVYNKPAEGNKVHNVSPPPPLEKVATLRPLDKKKLVFFAAGALYDILPLWVAEGSGCEGTLLDLENYSSKLVDDGVVAWPVSHTDADHKNKKREVEFTIKAQVLKAKEESKEGDKEEKKQEKKPDVKDEL